MTARSEPQGRARDRGFTLIELLAAMAILAVVSVMAVQALGGIFAQRAVLTRIDGEAASLARALALLRADLEAAAPAPMRGIDGTEGVALARTDSGFALARAGLGEAPDGAIGQVRWGLDADGTLWRQAWPSLRAGVPAGPRVPILGQVTGLTLAPLGGQLPSALEPTALPPGLEAVLTHRRHGDLRIAVAR